MFHAEIEATSRCNTRCLHCPHEAITRPGGRMDWATFETIAGKIRAYAGGERFSLSFSGMGEPLLNPLIFRFVRHVSDYAVTSFATNAAALTADNVLKLIAAGLDRIYVSFNGDNPEVFAEMMGGLSFERILANVRQAVRAASGTRLKIAANVSVAKPIQDRVTRIKDLLHDEGIENISFSLCHNRGGNLQAPEICDTPPMGVDSWRCDVLEHTLFVDWQGRAHICDHDLHGEYGIGDLVAEPLETILQRRRQILDGGCALKICRECNDIMKVGGTYPLQSQAGGNFREWGYYLYQDMADPMSEANEALKWIHRISEKDRRTDRLVNRLVGLEKIARRELGEALARARAAESETRRLAAELTQARQTLAMRDQEFAALHADYVAMRRNGLWRLARMIGNDLARLRRFWLGLVRGSGPPS